MGMECLWNCERDVGGKPSISFKKAESADGYNKIYFQFRMLIESRIIYIRIALSDSS